VVTVKTRRTIVIGFFVFISLVGVVSGRQSIFFQASGEAHALYFYSTVSQTIAALFGIVLTVLLITVQSVSSKYGSRVVLEWVRNPLLLTTAAANVLTIGWAVWGLGNGSLFLVPERWALLDDNIIGALAVGSVLLLVLSVWDAVGTLHPLMLTKYALANVTVETVNRTNSYKYVSDNDSWYIRRTRELPRESVVDGLIDIMTGLLKENNVSAFLAVNHMVLSHSLTSNDAPEELEAVAELHSRLELFYEQIYGGYITVTVEPWRLTRSACWSASEQVCEDFRSGHARSAYVKLTLLSRLKSFGDAEEAIIEVLCTTAATALHEADDELLAQELSHCLAMLSLGRRGAQFADRRMEQPESEQWYTAWGRIQVLLGDEASYFQDQKTKAIDAAKRALLDDVVTEESMAEIIYQVIMDCQPARPETLMRIDERISVKVNFITFDRVRFEVSEGCFIYMCEAVTLD